MHILLSRLTTHNVFLFASRIYRVIPIAPKTFFFYSYGPHRDLHSFPTRRSSDLGGKDESTFQAPASLESPGLVLSCTPSAGQLLGICGQNVASASTALRMLTTAPHATFEPVAKSVARSQV